MFTAEIEGTVTILLGVLEVLGSNLNPDIEYSD
jgi:hypothetical protein